MAVIYLCPADKRLSCSWEGSAGDIKQHFENEHDRLIWHTNCVEIDLEELPENKLLILDEEIYLMQNCIDKDKLVTRLRYLGSNENASKIQYDLVISIDKFSYKYEPARRFSCVVPTAEGWHIDLQCLEKLHGELNTIKCTVLLNYTVRIQREPSTIDLERKISTISTERKSSTISTERKLSTISTERRISDISLKINNQFIEANVCDETEQRFLNDMDIADERLKMLKQKERESVDFMDKISLLNFPMLEKPFTQNEEVKENTDNLPDIPEEANLFCSSCQLDMLPPIYLCINGHNVCSWCRSKPCEICKGAITINRNTNLENISRTRLHHCRYLGDGCNEKLVYNEVRAHEARCPFCKYNCMSCPYQGRFEHFLNHLKIVHSSVKLATSTRNDFPKDLEMYVVNKAVGIFYCNSVLHNEMITWRATFCGPRERWFTCELIFKGSKHKDPIFLKRTGNVYAIKMTMAELKKNKAKEKYAVLNITSYDS